MKDLRTRTVQATGWVFGSKVVSQMISFGFGIALARLLVPDDFGLIAMVFVFTNMASLLSDVGLGSALIQKKNASEEHYSSVFWLNICMGCLLALLLFFISGLLSVFYERPEIQDICKALSVSYILGAIGLVQRIRFQKELLFKYNSIADLVAMVVSGAIAITLAAYGFGYWALVVHTLAQQIISTMIIWVVSDWRPKAKINISAIKELFGFSASVLGTRALQYTTNNIDKLLLGKFLGGQIVGLYDKAQSMMLFPLQNVSQVVGGVMFPSLSLIQMDKQRVKNVYLRSIRAIALLTFPMMTGMFVVADSFVLGLLGAKWIEIVPVLQVFCVAGIVTSIVRVTGSLYLSQGAASLQLRVNLFTQPLRIVGVVFGLQWGLMGVAIAFVLTTYINSFITLTIAGRLVNLSVIDFVRTLSPVLVPAIAMAVTIWAIRPVIGIENELVVFIIQIFSGILLYWGFIFIFKLKAYEDVSNVLLGEIRTWKNNGKRTKPSME
jgi:PST family polysaccharide transporter